MYPKDHLRSLATRPLPVSRAGLSSQDGSYCSTPVMFEVEAYARLPSIIGCSLVAVLIFSLSSCVSSFGIGVVQLSAMMSNSEQSSTDGNIDDEITILGFGSLLSLKSAQLTFPTLKHFRLGRVPNHRRVFAHPASIFFQRGIASLDTLEMSSLSCEYEEGSSLICSVLRYQMKGFLHLMVV